MLTKFSGTAIRRADFSKLRREKRYLPHYSRRKFFTICANGKNVV